jgi:hypothetical protein
VCGLDGSCLRAFRAYGDALGLKSVAWAPSGQLLALGSYDQVGPAYTLLMLCFPRIQSLFASDAPTQWGW